jgi:hypothetical protein
MEENNHNVEPSRAEAQGRVARCEAQPGGRDRAAAAAALSHAGPETTPASRGGSGKATPTVRARLRHPPSGRGSRHKNGPAAAGAGPRNVLIVIIFHVVVIFY